MHTLLTQQRGVGLLRCPDIVLEPIRGASPYTTRQTTLVRSRLWTYPWRERVDVTRSQADLYQDFKTNKQTHTHTRTRTHTHTHTPKKKKTQKNPQAGNDLLNHNSHTKKKPPQQTIIN